MSNLPFAAPGGGRRPPKLLVKGFEGPSAMRELIANQFGGEIRQFYLQCAQNHQAGIIDQTAHRHDNADRRLRYTNIHGRELVTIEVHAAVVEKLAQLLVDQWDFALIELFMPDAYYAQGGAQLICLAHLTLPIEQNLTFTDVWPVNGVAANFLTRETPDKMINGAVDALLVRTAAGSDQEAYASFTVDLRPAHGLSAVIVDLHPYLYITTELQPGAVVFINPLPLYTSDPPEPMSEYEGLHSYIWSEANYLHGDIGNGIFLDTDLQWKFSISGEKTYVEFLGFYSIGLGPPTYNWYSWYVYTQNNYQPPYTGPNPVPAEVQLTLFKGVPGVDVTKYTTVSGIAYDRWTFPASFPARPGHMKLANTLVPAFNNTTFPNPTETPYISQMYGIPRLGKVIIGMKTTDGAAWQPE